MNRVQVTSSQDVLKAPTTLDKIPEDVQLAIIKFIQSWKKSEGSEQEKGKGERARDSALRAVALSCRKLLSIYRPELLANVTLNILSIFRFYLALARDHDYGKLVRSITLTHRDVEATPEQAAEAQKNSIEVVKALRAQGIKVDDVNIFMSVVEGLYRFLPNIQTLTILQSGFSIHLQSKLANDRLAPLPFLTHSLKKLFIPLWGALKHDLKASNVVWILVFCTGLRSAALGCVFDENDFKYLAEFSDTFSGSSKVLKLSLGLNFTPAESIQRYWDRGVGKQWIGGNRKTQAVFYLLKVTKNLQCLELNHLPSEKNETTYIKFDCLSALKASFKSLENLRILGIAPHYYGPEQFKANFLCFVQVRVLYLDALTTASLPRSQAVKLPPGLKILCIPYYYGHSSVQEDLELASFLKVGSLAALESVVVPSRPILRDGFVKGSGDYKKRWLDGRRELGKAHIFQSGKVKLRIVEPGEAIGESSEIDFMSIFTWLSPP